MIMTRQSNTAGKDLFYNDVDSLNQFTYKKSMFVKKINQHLLHISQKDLATSN